MIIYMMFLDNDENSCDLLGDFNNPNYVLRDDDEPKTTKSEKGKDIINKILN